VGERALSPIPRVTPCEGDTLLPGLSGLRRLPSRPRSSLRRQASQKCVAERFLPVASRCAFGHNAFRSATLPANEGKRRASRSVLTRDGGQRDRARARIAAAARHERPHRCGGPKPRHGAAPELSRRTREPLPRAARQGCGEEGKSGRRVSIIVLWRLSEFDNALHPDLHQGLGIVMANLVHGLDGQRDL